VEPLLAAGAVFASNTSAIPITDLAKASGAPERFIGLHFFSPVEQMPLLEVICGEATDEHTLGRCLAFARDLRKTVIVVNDGYGFYTSRTFSAYLLEGVQLVAEGYDPATVEWAARSVGMVVAPLQVFDEVSLSLGRKGLEQAAHYGKASDLAAIDLIRRMVDDHDRMGKASGSGFYDYLNGRRLGIWPGLADLVPESGRAGDVATLGRRLILAEVAEVARCLDEGILRSYRDAEVGAIFGIGFAPNTGGPLAFMDRVGLPELVAELDALAEAHGDRFRPAPVLRKMAAAGERFFAEGIPA
jgi:3-hydroxyacyl-CoA dehydrogenase/enoyl-CoA hydratase/3-hydroxybutyryl-CoA epimerase